MTEETLSRLDLLGHVCHEDCAVPCMLDLRQRLRDAHSELRAMSERTESRSKGRPLRDKAEGVGLALSYVEEAIGHVG